MQRKERYFSLCIRAFKFDLKVLEFLFDRSQRSAMQHKSIPFRLDKLQQHCCSNVFLYDVFQYADMLFCDIRKANKQMGIYSHDLNEVHCNCGYDQEVCDATNLWWQWERSALVAGGPWVDTPFSCENNNIQKKH